MSNLNCSGAFVICAVHVFVADLREMRFVATTTCRLWPTLWLVGKPEPLKEQCKLGSCSVC